MIAFAAWLLWRSAIFFFYTLYATYSFLGGLIYTLWNVVLVVAGTLYSSWKLIIIGVLLFGTGSVVAEYQEEMFQIADLVWECALFKYVWQPFSALFYYVLNLGVNYAGMLWNVFEIRVYKGLWDVIEFAKSIPKIYTLDGILELLTGIFGFVTYMLSSFDDVQQYHISFLANWVHNITVFVRSISVLFWWIFESIPRFTIFNSDCMMCEIAASIDIEDTCPLMQRISLGPLNLGEPVCTRSTIPLADAKTASQIGNLVENSCHEWVCDAFKTSWNFIASFVPSQTAADRIQQVGPALCCFFNTLWIRPVFTVFALASACITTDVGDKMGTLIEDWFLDLVSCLEDLFEIITGSDNFWEQLFYALWVDAGKVVKDIKATVACFDNSTYKACLRTYPDGCSVNHDLLSSPPVDGDITNGFSDCERMLAQCINDTTVILYPQTLKDFFFEVADLWSWVDYIACPWKQLADCFASPSCSCDDQGAGDAGLCIPIYATSPGPCDFFLYPSQFNQDVPTRCDAVPTDDCHNYINCLEADSISGRVDISLVDYSSSACSSCADLYPEFAYCANVTAQNATMNGTLTLNGTNCDNATAFYECVKTYNSDARTAWQIDNQGAFCTSQCAVCELGRGKAIGQCIESNARPLQFLGTIIYDICNWLCTVVTPIISIVGYIQQFFQCFSGVTLTNFADKISSCLGTLIDNFESLKRDDPQPWNVTWPALLREHGVTNDTACGELLWGLVNPDPAFVTSFEGKVYITYCSSVFHVAVDAHGDCPGLDMNPLLQFGTDNFTTTFQSCYNGSFSGDGTMKRKTTPSSSFMRWDHERRHHPDYRDEETILRKAGRNMLSLMGYDPETKEKRAKEPTEERRGPMRYLFDLFMESKFWKLTDAYISFHENVTSHYLSRSANRTILDDREASERVLYSYEETAFQNAYDKIEYDQTIARGYATYATAIIAEMESARSRSIAWKLSRPRGTPMESKVCPSCVTTFDGSTERAISVIYPDVLLSQRNKLDADFVRSMEALRKARDTATWTMEQAIGKSDKLLSAWYTTVDLLGADAWPFFQGMHAWMDGMRNRKLNELWGWMANRTMYVVGEGFVTHERHAQHAREAAHRMTGRAYDQIFGKRDPETGEVKRFDPYQKMSWRPFYYRPLVAAINSTNSAGIWMEYIKQIHLEQRARREVMNSIYSNAAVNRINWDRIFDAVLDWFGSWFSGRHWWTDFKLSLEERFLGTNSTGSATDTFLDYVDRYVRCDTPENFDGTNITSPFCVGMWPYVITGWIQQPPNRFAPVQIPWPDALIRVDCNKTFNGDIHVFKNGGITEFHNYDWAFNLSDVCPSHADDPQYPLCPHCDLCKREYYSCSSVGYVDFVDSISFVLGFLPWLARVYLYEGMDANTVFAISMLGTLMLDFSYLSFSGVFYLLFVIISRTMLPIYITWTIFGNVPYPIAVLYIFSKWFLKKLSNEWGTPDGIATWVYQVYGAALFSFAIFFAVRAFGIPDVTHYLDVPWYVATASYFAADYPLIPFLLIPFSTLYIDYRAIGDRFIVFSFGHTLHPELVLCFVWLFKHWGTILLLATLGKMIVVAGWILFLVSFGYVVSILSAMWALGMGIFYRLFQSRTVTRMDTLSGRLDEFELRIYRIEQMLLSPKATELLGAYGAPHVAIPMPETTSPPRPGWPMPSLRGVLGGWRGRRGKSD
jgi:hypothetical protein